MAFREKLIRDNLDRRIPAEQLRIASDAAEIERLLIAKLDEELQELAASGYNDAAEYADVLEVLMALATRRGIEAVTIARARQAKRREKGGFGRGLVWRAPTDPADIDSKQ